MKKTSVIKSILILFWVILPFIGHSQTQNNDLFPSVSTKNKKSVILDRFSVQISVVGNIAVTTYDMTFKNREPRVLEGQLEFPLQESEQVIGYQLEVNGKMRKGVVVEKQEARQIFETIVNRNVDPGIIEKTQGNNYRTRLYPIPARGLKRVIITTQQTLSKQLDHYVYVFPFQSQINMSQFSIEFEIIDQASKPLFGKKGISNLIFNKRDKGYYMVYSNNSKPQCESFSVLIPIDQSEPKNFYESFDQDTFFYSVSSIGETDHPLLKPFLPDSLFVLWDVSLSGLNRDLKKEFLFLNQFLEQYPNKSITIIPFNNKLLPGLSFNTNDFEQINAMINGFHYDGASNMNVLSQLYLRSNHLSLIFSDGINSLGEVLNKEFNLGIPFCVVSAMSNDYSKLEYISHNRLFHIGKNSFENCFYQMKNIPLKLISMEIPGGFFELTIKEDDLQKPELIICGKMSVDSGTIICHFGYQDEPFFSKRIPIHYSGSQDLGLKKSEVSKVVSRYWAQHKIKELSYQLPESKNNIKYFAKKYEIVTDYTSLIVLENMADYVRYHVEPPPELQEEYKNYITKYGKPNRSNNPTKLPVQEIIRLNFLQYYRPLVNWYNNFYSDTYGSFDDIIFVPQQHNPYPQMDTTKSPGSIFGKVIDFHTKQPISDLKVTLENSSSIIQSVTTDVNGFYTFNPVYPGLYTLEISNNKCNVKQRYRYYFPDSNSSNLLNLTFNCINHSYDKNYIEYDSNASGNIRVRGNRNDGQTTIIDGVRVSGSSSIITSTSIEREELNRTPGRSVSTSNESSSNQIYSYTPVVRSGGSSRNTNSGNVNQTNSQIITNTEPSTNTKILLNPYSGKEGYLETFQSINKEDYYSNYLKIRDQYLLTPSFFVVVADLFYQNGMKDTAKIILSNMIENTNENFQIVQEYGNKLIEYGFYEDAVPVFKYLTELREEFPQSFRDYALACEWAGRYQEAYDVMISILSKDWTRFNAIKMIVFNELNGLMASHNEQINTKGISPLLVAPMPMKLRVVISWNTDNCDMDLHVKEPDGKFCYYGFKNTPLGGRLSFDVTNGFGPEEYLMKNHVNGKYEIRVKYYNSRSQAQLMPVVIYADIYTDYGTPLQKHKRVSLQLLEKNDNFLIGEVEVEP